MSLMACEQGFVQFLARSETGDPDLRTIHAVKFYVSLDEVENLDWLSDIENVGFAVARFGAGLDHQTDSLGYRHEVAGDFGVSNGNRLAVRELVSECVVERPAAAERVAEPYGRECCFSARVGLYE